MTSRQQVLSYYTKAVCLKHFDGSYIVWVSANSLHPVGFGNTPKLAWVDALNNIKHLL